MNPYYLCCLSVCRCLTWNWARSSTFHRTKRKVARLLRSCLTSSSTVRLWSSLVTSVFISSSHFHSLDFLVLDDACSSEMYWCFSTALEFNRSNRSPSSSHIFIIGSHLISHCRAALHSHARTPTKMMNHLLPHGKDRFSLLRFQSRSQQGCDALYIRRMVIDVMKCSQFITYFLPILQKLEHLLGQSVNIWFSPPFIRWGSLTFLFIFCHFLLIWVVFIPHYHLSQLVPQIDSPYHICPPSDVLFIPLFVF